MTAKKSDIPSVDAITPLGTAQWPKLNTPDTYKGKTTFNTKLVFDPEEDSVVGKKAGNLYQAGIEMRDAYYDEVVAKLTAEAAELRAAKKGAKAKEVEAKIAELTKADVGKAEADEETGEETGNIIILAKTNAFYKDKKTGQERQRQIDVFDARGKKLKNIPQIGGGSKLKLGVTMRPYLVDSSNTVGVTFYLNAVQIVDLVSFGGRDAGAYGFGEEDGYEYDDTGDDAPFADTTGADDATNF